MRPRSARRVLGPGLFTLLTGPACLTPPSGPGAEAATAASGPKAVPPPALKTLLAAAEKLPPAPTAQPPAPRLFDHVPGSAYGAPTTAFEAAVARREDWADGAVERHLEGTVLQLKLRTTRSFPDGSLDFGWLHETPRGRHVRLRRYARLARPDAGAVYDGRIDLAAMVRPSRDVSETARRGFGILAYRLRLPDPTSGRERFRDGFQALRCAPTPCDQSSRFWLVPTVELGPVVDQVRPDGALVSLRTDEPAAAALYFDASEVPVALSPAVDRHHRIAVSGLAADRCYPFTPLLKAEDGRVSVGPRGTLCTAPRADTERRIRVAILSDSRGAPGGGEYNFERVNRRVLRRLMAQISEQDLDLALFVGDLISGYTPSPRAYWGELAAWHQSVDPYAAHLPIYESMGNHEALVRLWDRHTWANRRAPWTAETLFAASVENPNNGPTGAPGEPPYDESVYSFDYGFAHFAVVNSNYHVTQPADEPKHPAGPGGYREGFVTDAQLRWLRADLKAAADRGQIAFVFTHEPAFPSGGHADDGMYWNGRVPKMNQQRKAFIECLADSGVEAVFFGDEHNYSRLLLDHRVAPEVKAPLWQIVTGGAGAPLYGPDRAVPWADRVAAFHAAHHFVELDIGRDQIRLRAIDDRSRTLDAVRWPPGHPARGASKQP